MDTRELVAAGRVIEGDHPLKRTPYNQIFAALSLALFVAVLLSAGWTWLLVTFIAWIIALLCVGIVSLRRALARLTQQREEDKQAHAATLAGRRTIARMPDATYEDQSAELAARFGRVDQTVPRHALPAEARRTKHTSELVAHGVLRTTMRGFPVTAFDLEVANEDDLALLSRKTRFENAFALSTCYLTVCAVTLPFPLPHLSALAAWSPGLVEAFADEKGLADVPPELRHTDDPEFAALMLSVPAVRKAAHDLHLAWTVSGDVLTASVLTPSGLPAHSVLRLANALAELAEMMPWDRLGPYRRDTVAQPAPWPEHRSPLLTYESWRTDNLLGPSMLRWWHCPLGKTGAYAFRSSPIRLGEPRQ